MPRDPSKLAKKIIDLATSDKDEPDKHDGKDPAAVALGRKGGLKGGKARAKKMTAAERSASALKAAKVRWSKAKGTRPRPRQKKKPPKLRQRSR